MVLQLETSKAPNSTPSEPRCRFTPSQRYLPPPALLTPCWLESAVKISRSDASAICSRSRASLARKEMDTKRIASISISKHRWHWRGWYRQKRRQCRIFAGIYYCNLENYRCKTKSVIFSELFLSHSCSISRKTCRRSETLRGLASPLSFGSNRDMLTTKILRPG